MNRKIVSIFVSMLLCVTILSVTGTEIVEEYEVPSCGLAPITSNCDVQDSQSQYNMGDLSDSGATCYAADASNDNFVWFDTDNPTTYNVIAPSSFTDFPHGGCFVEDIWWVCDTNGRIYTADETSGIMTYVGNAGTGGLSGLAYDPASGILYGSSLTNLYTIDQGTGVATLIGPFNALDWMISIACDGSGNMYGFDLEMINSPFYSISTSSGAVTLIGYMGIGTNWGQDMAYDIDNDVLYLCAIRHSGGSGYAELYTIDTSSGVATYLGNLAAGAQTTCAAIPYNISLPPDVPSIPSGPTEGFVDIEYTFCTSTTDPEGEQVYYMWDWGDGTTTDWLGPFDSGATVCASHAWTEIGTYEITVKAKDVHDVESEWSDPLTIHIINTAILEIGNITGKLFKINTVIRNIGGVDATMVNWNITLDGGIILLGKETSGNILSLSAGGEKTISSDSIFGFGNTIITVTAECDEGSSDTKTRDAFVFLFFIL